MAFGQASGPPATAKQLGELLELLHQAGHADFRDARGPLGFNQRQAAGKFTRDEADAFIERLAEAADNGPTDDVSSLPDAPAPNPPPRLTKASTPRRSSADEVVRKIPTTVLAAELQRRGWVVLEP